MADTASTDTASVAAATPGAYDSSALIKSLSKSLLTQDKEYKEGAATRDKAITDSFSSLASQQPPPPPSPPTPTPPPQQRERSPVETFGSAASALAIFGSLLTRRPLVNALNGSTAAMNAIKQGDAEAYKAAYKTWQDESEYASKLFEQQNAVYNDILNNKRLSFEEKNALLGRAFVAQQDDAKHAQWLAGQQANVINMIVDQERFTKQMDEARKNATPDKIEGRLMNEALQIKDPQQQLARLNQIHGIFHPEKAQTLQQAELDQWTKLAAAHPEWTPDDTAQHFQDFIRSIARGKSPDEQRRLELKDKLDAEHKAKVDEITKTRYANADDRKQAEDAETKRWHDALAKSKDDALQVQRDRLKQTRELSEAAQTETKRWHDLVAQGHANDAQKKQAAKASELSALTDQIDGILNVVDKDWTVAGATGQAEAGYNATLGQFVGGFQDRRTFDNKMLQLQRMIQTSYLNSRYFSKSALGAMEELVPGLTVTQGSEDTKAALIELRNLVNNQIKDGMPGAEGAGDPEKAPSGPPAPGQHKNWWEEAPPIGQQ